MADEATTTTASADVKKQAVTLVDTIEKISGRLDAISGQQDKLAKDLEEAKKPQYPAGAPYVRRGEDPMSSRPYSMMRMAMALRKRQDQDMDWNYSAKMELDLSKRLKTAYHQTMGYAAAGELIPLGTDLMPTECREVVDKESGKTFIQPGLDAKLVKECRDAMHGSLASFDPSELEHLEKQGLAFLRKDMSANVATTGGTFVAFASQGELIDLLRGIEVFSRAGAQEIDLPPQGSIRFPRVTSGVTISAYAEAATVTESTPGTGHLLLQAKKYAGLVDIPEELLKFSTSVAVETWLRSEFVRDIGLQVDADMIAGNGGTAIQGCINYTGSRVVLATTVAAQGNTLEAQDPMRLYADIADQNAPVDRGFFFALRNTLWGGICTRRASEIVAADALGSFVFAVGTNQAGGGKITQTLNGHLVITSTQVPANRLKGAATTLTMLLGGVGAEWLIARAGVIEFSMTNSDASKFVTGLSTMRGTMFIDAGPRHEQSFGMIDDLLNA
jgi:HK97 family phage major capsid protein